MVSAMRRLCLQKSTLRMGSENGCTKIYGEKKNRLQNSKIVVPASVHGVAAAAIGCDVCGSCVRRVARGARPEERLTAVATAWLPTVIWKATATAAAGGGAPEPKPASRANEPPNTDADQSPLKSRSAQNHLRVTCLQQDAGMLPRVADDF